jgi:hypothetical protein
MDMKLNEKNVTVEDGEVNQDLIQEVQKMNFHRNQA